MGFEYMSKDKFVNITTSNVVANGQYGEQLINLPTLINEWINSGKISTSEIVIFSGDFPEANKKIAFDLSSGNTYVNINNNWVLFTESISYDAQEDYVLQSSDLISYSGDYLGFQYNNELNKFAPGNYDISLIYEGIENLTASYTISLNSNEEFAQFLSQVITDFGIRAIEQSGLVFVDSNNTPMSQAPFIGRFSLTAICNSTYILLDQNYDLLSDDIKYHSRILKEKRFKKLPEYLKTIGNEMTPATNTIGSVNNVPVKLISRGETTIWYNNNAVGIFTDSPTSTFSVKGDADKIGGGTWGTFSDANYKKNITPYINGLEHLLKLEPVSFEYIDEIEEADNVHVGLIAQEVEKILPSAVKDKIKNGKPIKTLDINEIFYVLINSIKQLHEEIETLKSKTKKK